MLQKSATRVQKEPGQDFPLEQQFKKELKKRKLQEKQKKLREAAKEREAEEKIKLGAKAKAKAEGGETPTNPQTGPVGDSLQDGDAMSVEKLLKADAREEQAKKDL